MVVVAVKLQPLTVFYFRHCCCASWRSLEGLTFVFVFVETVVLHEHYLLLPTLPYKDYGSRTTPLLADFFIFSCRIFKVVLRGVGGEWRGDFHCIGIHSPSPLFLTTYSLTEYMLSGCRCQWYDAAKWTFISSQDFNSCLYILHDNLVLHSNLINQHQTEHTKQTGVFKCLISY